MKLTFKAIARMAGYRVRQYEQKYAYTDHPQFYWEDILGGDDSLAETNCFDSVDEAYEACVQYCKLVDQGK